MHVSSESQRIDPTGLGSAATRVWDMASSTYIHTEIYVYPTEETEGNIFTASSINKDSLF